MNHLEKRRGRLPDEITQKKRELTCATVLFLLGTGAEHGTRGTSAEGERLVDLFIYGLLGASGTRGKRERAKANLSPWLYEEDGIDSAVRELSVFMTSRCLAYKDQSQTIRGYLAAIKYLFP